MKLRSIILAIAGLAASASVFAQSTQAPSGNTAAPAQVSQVAQAANPGYDGQWVAPYGEPVHQKTRAEVYQELVHAEQDGQLQYLNSTLYAH
jgi:hypothetical protein